MLAIFGIATIISGSFFKTNNTNNVTVLNSKKEEFLRFDDFKRINKTDLLISKLISAETAFGSLKDYSNNSIKNVLLFNVSTSKGEWFFPTNQNAISNDFIFIHEDKNDDCCDKYKENKSKAIGMIFYFADKDTNGDEQITSKDKLKLTYKDLETNKNSTVLSNIDHVLEVERVSENEIGVFYTRESKSFYMKYNYINQKAFNEIPL